MRRALLAASAFLLMGCYHATIETGATPGTQVVENPWVHSFVYGLVPPATVNVASQCPRGAARVETRHSFVNGLVAGLTFSLYTPMTIKVTCAQ